MKCIRAIRNPSVFSIALWFEGSLAVVGAGIAWLVDLPLLMLLLPTSRIVESLTCGIIATLPLLLLLVVLLACGWPPIARLRQFVARLVTQLFGIAPLWRLAAVSAMAGLGEEVLFRGTIQPLAVQLTTPLAGLLLTSLLFGLVHATSLTYFFLATTVGAYLGTLAMARGEILSAVVVHGLYDFVALTCLSRGCYRRGRPLFAVPPNSVP